MVKPARRRSRIAVFDSLAALAAVAVVLSAAARPLVAQNVPLISGGMGFLTTTNGGNTDYIPTIAPVAEVPLTDKVLIESKANLLEIFFPRHGLGYDTSHFIGLSYLQADVQVAPKLTVTAGYFYTPFNTFVERLSPIWINKFEDAPFISSINGNGGSLGGMLRGNLYQNDKVSISYAGYFSGKTSNEQFTAKRASGGRVSVYFPKAGLEVGASGNAVLQGTRQNNIGLHVWWTPEKSNFRFRSEFAHAPHAKGYWTQAEYRMAKLGGAESFFGRFEPLVRWQQILRGQKDSSDGLPSVSEQRIDLGLDYHLPHELRMQSSYARQFSATRNVNIWETGLVYRFLFPAWKGRK